MKVEVTSPDRVLWPDSATTKIQLIDYYREVGDLLVAELRDRLLTLKRAPGGIEGEIFFQKNAPKYTPDWIKTETVPTAKRDVSYLVCNSVDTLIWIGNQSGVELHLCLDRVDKPGRPDLLVFDLDPTEGNFDLAVKGALTLRRLLQDVGLDPSLKTTGGKGLHVYVRLERRYDFSAVHAFAVAVGERAVAAEPELLTLEFKKSDRGGRVLVDVHRNGPGATIVAPFSPRARPGAPLSFPISWDQLGKVEPGDFTIAQHDLRSIAVKEWKSKLKQRARLPSL